MPDTVYLYRRHTRTCGRKRGDNHRCNCPAYADGILNGRRWRESMKTSDWKAAQDKLRRRERGDEPVEKSIREASEEWKAQLTVEESTKRKYIRAVGSLVEFLTGNGLRYLAQIRARDMQEFRSIRTVGKGTLGRDIQVWRLFFSWCMGDGREWLRKNPGKWVSVTKKAKPKPVQPYTKDEIGKIFAACDLIGRTAYERLRARALVAVLRYTGLRIGDALMLSGENIQDGQVHVYTQKEGTQVWLPLHPEVGKALELLPPPRRAVQNCRHYFWNEQMSRRALLGIGERMLHRVFELSGVKDAHAHRFRHSLAIDILTTGGTLADVAAALGNTEAIVAKHYAPWCTARQERLTEVLGRAFDGAVQSHHGHTAKAQSVN